MSGLKLCFWGYAEGNPSIDLKMHTNDFYQMQFSLSGECDFITESGRIRLRKHDILLVAPNVPHRLEYRGKYLSHAYKFYCDDMPDLYLFHYLGISSVGYFLAKPGIISPLAAYVLSTVAGFGGAILLYEIISRIPVYRWMVMGMSKKKKKKEA